MSCIETLYKTVRLDCLTYEKKSLISSFQINKNRVCITHEMNKNAKWIMNADKIVTYMQLDGAPCAIFNQKLYKSFAAETPKLVALAANAQSKEAYIGSYEIEEGSSIIKDDWLLYGWGAAVGYYWVPANEKDKYYIEAFNNLRNKQDGVYDLIGKKIADNYYKLKNHILVKRDSPELRIMGRIPTTLIDLHVYLNEVTCDYNYNDQLPKGVIWRNVDDDSKIVSIRRDDFKRAEDEYE